MLTGRNAVKRMRNQSANVIPGHASSSERPTRT